MSEQIIKSSKSLNFSKGKKGETEATRFLEDNGYKILFNNYKTKLGEIDIIAKDKEDRIIFVEVKARETARFGYPRQAVNKQKQITIRRVAELYLIKNKLLNCYTRFDVIEILAGNITHIKNAF